MKGSFARWVAPLVVVLCWALTGCLGVRDWQYPPFSSGRYLEAKASKPIQARVVVLPFEDLRGTEVKEEYWKAAIPLMLYGETEYDRPEAIQTPEPVDVVRFHPPEDFAKATAAELHEAGVFSSVVYAKDAKSTPADLVFRGRLRSTDWNRRLYTYFLGPLGVVFWLVGVPMGETTTTVELDLRLTPVNDPARVVWSMAMEFEGRKWDSPYYNLEDAVQSYPAALQEALRPAITDLVQLAETDPRRLFQAP